MLCINILSIPSQWLLINIFACVASSLIEIQYLITLEGSSFSSLSQAVFTDFFHLRLVLLVLGPKSWTVCCVLNAWSLTALWFLFFSFVRQGLIFQHRRPINCQSGQRLPRAGITGLYYHTSSILYWVNLLCTTRVRLLGNFQRGLPGDRLCLSLALSDDDRLSSRWS